MRLFSLIFMTFAAFAAPALGQADTRPNIVFIIADDLAWDDLGCTGNPGVRTPNLDRLAKGGMRFTNAYLTISSCSPSRASIITGTYPHQTDAEQLHWPLPADRLTFVELLKASGYWTAAAGKWHLGNAVKDRFDEVREADVSGFQLPTGEAAKAGKIVQKAVGDARSGCDQWVPVLKARPTDKPFFLWLAALDPHRDYDEGILEQPHKPGDVRLPPYVADTPGSRRDYALYYDEITRLDRFVGGVMAELKEQNVADNTFVLFISDNGRPFPRDKTTLYDSGIKTPFIVHWPGHVGAGSRCNSLLSSVDIAPAFLELAGLSTPKVFEGSSFLPLLRNPQQGIREFVFAERNWHDYEDRVRAVRNRRFKYIRNFYNDLPNTPPADVVRSVAYREMIRLRDEGRLVDAQKNTFIQPRAKEELYDTQSDPFELKNLASHPAQARRLKRFRSALAKWQKETGDTKPRFRTLDEFGREDGQALPVRERPRPNKAEMTRRLEAHYRKQAN
jgi:arylsulfatase A-like enzyme